MPATLDLATIAGNVCDYWELNFPLDVATAYPGVPLDTHDLAEWIELEMPEVTRLPGRDSGLQRRAMLLRVHVVVRRSTDLSRLNTLAEAALTTISRITIPLYTPDSNETLLGYLQTFEGQVQNHTRECELLRATISLGGIVQDVE